ncbi:MAG: cystathionine beta-synthase, partial [Nonlabens ulvanivorans]
MKDNKVLNYIEDIIKNHPADWLGLTTHRLDIYNEKLAKTQFLDQLETLYSKNNASTGALAVLPTAYDYIRLGHPLSSVLEWGIAHLHGLDAENVISFSSKTIPVLAVLRKNLLEDRDTQINYTGELPAILNSELLKEVYGYHFQLQKVNAPSDVAPFNGSTIFIAEHDEINTVDLNSNIVFSISLHGDLGS